MDGNKATETATSQKKRFPQKWKPVHERLLSMLLAGKTGKDAAAELGLSEWYVCRLQRWPVFERRLRLRRSAIVNASDSALMNADLFATSVLVRCMQRIAPQQIEVVGRDGKTKFKTLRADPDLALSAAFKVKQLNREKIGEDPAMARLEAMEAKFNKANKESK